MNSSSTERLVFLKNEYSDATVGFQKAVGALPGTAEGEKRLAKLEHEYAKGQANRLLSAVNLARADPNGPIAIAALEWVLENSTEYGLDAGKVATELLRKHHAASPRVVKILALASLKAGHAVALTELRGFGHGFW